MAKGLSSVGAMVWNTFLIKICPFDLSVDDGCVKHGSTSFGVALFLPSKWHLTRMNNERVLPYLSHFKVVKVGMVSSNQIAPLFRKLISKGL